MLNSFNASLAASFGSLIVVIQLAWINSQTRKRTESWRLKTLYENGRNPVKLTKNFQNNSPTLFSADRIFNEAVGVMVDECGKRWERFDSLKIICYIVNLYFNTYSVNKLSSRDFESELILSFHDFAYGAEELDSDRSTSWFIGSNISSDSDEK